MGESAASYGFLCGADMAPGSIRRNDVTADSRFVDIGSVAAADVAGLNLPLPDAGTVWGVVVTLPGGQPDASTVPVTLRRASEVVEAVVLTDVDSFGSPEDAIAEAYYWELPRSWREALEANLGDFEIAQR